MAKRVTRQLMFMDMAEAASMRSTCFRANVGAILVRDNNVISIGYNGPAAGEQHCTGNSCQVNDNGGCKRSVHAEMNAYKRAPLLSSFQWTDTILYCTHQPCDNCAEEIIIHNTACVVYQHPYRCNKGLQRLLDADVGVIRMTKCGYMVDMKTNEIIRDETY